MVGLAARHSVYMIGERPKIDRVIRLMASQRLCQPDQALEPVATHGVEERQAAVVSWLGHGPAMHNSLRPDLALGQVRQQRIIILGGVGGDLELLLVNALE